MTAALIEQVAKARLMALNAAAELGRAEKLIRAASLRIERRTGGIQVPSDVSEIEVMIENDIVRFEGSPKEIVEQLEARGILATAADYTRDQLAEIRTVR